MAGKRFDYIELPLTPIGAPHDAGELTVIVDDSDKIIGEAPLSKVHGEGLLHRESYCYIINLEKQVLLQKREDNSLWDNSAAGHYSLSDPTYRDCIRRETEEELGIRLSSEDFREIGQEKLVGPSRYGVNNRFIKLFLVEKDISLQDIRPDPGEVVEAKYFSLDELKLLLSADGQMTSTAKYLIAKYILPLITREVKTPKK